MNRSTFGRKPASKKSYNTTQKMDSEKKDNNLRINKFSVLQVDEDDEDTNNLVPINTNKKEDNLLINKSTEVEVQENTQDDEGEWIFSNKKEKQKNFKGREQFRNNIHRLSDRNYDKESQKNKELYIDNDSKVELGDLGNTMYLQSPWTVWVHKSDCQVWTEESYTNIYVINSIGSFWRFFNNFHLLDKSRNQFFIMRNKIKPIWEDNENRNGGICSIKLDCFSKHGKIDIGIEIMVCICLLIMNETFVQDNEEINGISYSIKNKSILIKLWCKNFSNKITDKLPIGLFNKLDNLLRNSDKMLFGRKSDNKISIRYTQIKPEYDVDL